MPPRGRPWMSAVPLALLPGLAVPALVRAPVDDASAAAALARPGAAIDPDGDTRRAAASSSWVKEG